MASVMQPSLFPSWLPHCFLTSLINFPHIGTESLFWTGTVQEMDKNNHAFCLYMEYKILVREIDIKSGDHVKNAIFGISRSWFNVNLLHFG